LSFVYCTFLERARNRGLGPASVTLIDLTCCWHQESASVAVNVFYLFTIFP